MRRRSRLLLLLLLACAQLSLLEVRAQSPTADSQSYGAYPENYEEVVTSWLDASLVDPASVKLKFLGKPRQGELDVGQGRKVAGYLVDFTVNARNVFGAFTGSQKHTALVRDGKVVTATGFLSR